MKRGTQAIIGATIVVLGLGFLALGALEQESNIRHVEDVRDDRIGAGTYTLLGVPEPAVVPVTGPEGVALIPNDQFVNHTTHTVAWQLDGETVHSTIVLSVEGTGNVHHWHYQNNTRYPGQLELIQSWNTTWTSGGHVFQIRAFDDGDGDTPVIWGHYEGVLRDPIQPKPSQFEGKRATALDAPLPPDALVWSVDTYTAGCSSKFLPPEEEEKYEDVAV